MESHDASVNIGFDIGIASVGWMVLDTNSGKIIETGVDLFSSANPEKM